MMKTKILIAICFLFTGIPVVRSQDQGRKTIHEVGISFSGLNNFGLRYKVGSQTTLFRLSALAVHTVCGRDTSLYNPYWVEKLKTNLWGGGLQVGFERRIKLADHFNFYAGMEIMASYIHRNDKRENDFTWEYRSISAGPGILLGFNYTWADRLVISAEFIPWFQYCHTYNKTSEWDNYPYSEHEVVMKSNTWAFSLSNSANITIAYRIGK